MTNLLQQRLNELHTDNAIDYPTYSELYDMAADIVSIATAELALDALRVRRDEVLIRLHRARAYPRAPGYISDLESFARRHADAIKELEAIAARDIERDLAAQEADQRREELAERLRGMLP